MKKVVVVCIILLIIFLLIALFLPDFLGIVKAKNPSYRSFNFQVGRKEALIDFREQDLNKILPDGSHPWIIKTGDIINLVAAPFIKNGRIWLAARDILILGSKYSSTIHWDSEARKVTMVFQKGTTDEIKIEITIGEKVVERNEKKIMLDATPFIRNDRVFIPVSFLTEVMRAREIIYIGETGSVIATWVEGI